MPSRKVRVDRVAFIHGSNDLYGASRVLLQDVAILKGLGLHVSVILPDDGPLTAELDRVGAHVSIEPLSVLRKVSGVAGLRLPVSIPDAVKKADLVVVWTLALVSYLPALRTRRKLVVTSIHEILEGALGASLVRFAALGSHGLMVNSKTTGEWVRAAALNRPKMALAYPEAPPYAPSAPPLFHSEVLNAFLAGRVNGHKGHLEAVAAGELVRREGIDLHLTLAGGSFPGQEAHLEALLSRIVDDDWVTYVGEVRDVAPLLARADVMLVPTTRPEPFGVVALEAWAAGRRVIATDEGGLAEATEMVEGLSIPARDIDALARAMVTVARSAELRQSPNRRAAVSRLCTPAARKASWRALLERIGVHPDV